MFLVTGRAGTILDHVRFMQRVLLMTRLALAIDLIETDSMLESILQISGKLRRSLRTRRHPSRLMTLRAIIAETRVSARYRTST